ncbi:hypothetical protein I41_05860 [Lacipirellula limnantheis]|uniref:Uncharacterized protein n=1 Tax=Lacipirellula limnantheis TaxID=2528024 RepID=A0A517TST6_9BACT|nr:hypothetical protein I41_05860 [Lacipirellula limnantheis]
MKEEELRDLPSSRVPSGGYWTYQAVQVSGAACQRLQVDDLDPDLPARWHGVGRWLQLDFVSTV